MRFLSRKAMAARRGISLSGEKRLEKLYPKQYGTMVEITPGRKGKPEDEDDRFNEFLIHRQKVRNAEARDVVRPGGPHAEANAEAAE